jgi:aminomethyltransferase
VEAGILNYGADMTLAENPYEVGLERLVDPGKKTDFIGKEALRRIKAEGVKRKLVGVHIQGERIEFNMTKWPVARESERVGSITSAIYSPRLKMNIGYALVPVEHSELGTRLTVSTPKDERNALVVRMPFVDPEKEIPKS